MPLVPYANGLPEVIGANYSRLGFQTNPGSSPECYYPTGSAHLRLRTCQSLEIGGRRWKALFPRLSVRSQRQSFLPNLHDHVWEHAKMRVSRPVKVKQARDMYLLARSVRVVSDTTTASRARAVGKDVGGFL
jgi:hypothetical protein